MQRIFEDSTQGGREITPSALAIAIRSAAMQCRDEMGNVSISKLYQLTCELENQSSYD